MTRKEILKRFLKTHGMRALNIKNEMDKFYNSYKLEDGECVISAYLSWSAIK